MGKGLLGCGAVLLILLVVAGGVFLWGTGVYNRLVGLDEVALGPEARVKPQDAPGGAARVERHRMPRALPELSLALEEVLHLERPLRVQPERGKVERHVSGLGVARIHVDQHQDHVAPVLGCLAERQQRGIIGLVEAERPVPLQRRVAPPNRIDRGDERA